MYLRRLDHRDDHDDSNQAVLTPEDNPDSTALVLNIFFSVLVVVGVLGFLRIYGVDKPIRTDGVSPGCGLACCAAIGLCPMNDGDNATRVYRQSALSTVLSIVGFVLWLVWAISGYRAHVAILAVTCSAVGIMLRGFYPGCCGDTCSGQINRGCCATCSTSRCSCTAASLMCCRVTNAVGGWVVLLPFVICGCIGPWCTLMWFWQLPFCLVSTVCMYMARCYAFAVPLKLRTDQPTATSATGQQEAYDPPQPMIWMASLPEATVAYCTPSGAQQNFVGWGSSVVPVEEPQVGLVLQQPSAPPAIPNGTQQGPYPPQQAKKQLEPDDLVATNHPNIVVQARLIVEDDEGDDDGNGGAAAAAAAASGEEKGNHGGGVSTVRTGDF